MINWRTRSKHLIKGFFSQIHTLASAIIIVPSAQEFSNSLIDVNGVASQSPINPSSVFSNSKINGAVFSNSLIDTNGVSTNSPIDETGQFTESPI